MVGAEAARILGVKGGSPLRLGGSSFTVLQAADAPPDGLDRAVFMPLAAAQRVLGRLGEISALRLGGCWCRIDVATLAGQVERLLPGTRAVTVAGMIEAQKGSVATMQRYSGVLHATGIGVVALVIASLVASQARRRRREPRAPHRHRRSPGPHGRAPGRCRPRRRGHWAVSGWLAAVPAARRLGQELLDAPLAAPGELCSPLDPARRRGERGRRRVPRVDRAAALDPTVVLRES